MTALAVVGSVADGGSGGVDHRKGLVWVVRCPGGDQDDDYPSGELAPCCADFPFLTATSHFKFPFKGGERFMVFAHASRKLDKQRSLYERVSHSLGIPAARIRTASAVQPRRNLTAGR